MEWAVVGLAACGSSALTLFSGFGLGTLLLPAFAFFFPLDAAVAMTAVVHLANNLFKLVLLGRHAHPRTVLLFGLPAIAAAYVGARLLVGLSDAEPLFTWTAGGRVFRVEPLSLGLAGLMAAFALLEIWPAFARWSAPRAWLPVGGLLSGFFGGLSGHQGALRGAFLLRAGLSKEAYLATGVVIACLVDVTRLATYAGHLGQAWSAENRPLLLFAMGMAFAGAYGGSKLLHKVTLRKVQLVVAAMLLVIAGLVGSGVI
jgi:uncharacterized membrane protein YfcA